MSAVMNAKMTEAEYLAKEEANDFRSEFYNGEMFAMAGASWAHNRIVENLSIRLGGKLWGGEYQTISSDQRVKIDLTLLYTYPDLAIICGEPEFAKSNPNSLVNPKIIFEVLSPKTELYDRTTKFEHYKRIPSFQEYVLVAQDKAFVESYIRQSDQKWLYQCFQGFEMEFQLATVPASVKMADIYAGVKFPEVSGALRITYEDQPPPAEA